MNWQLIETAPLDGIGHLRGRWISSQGRRLSWTVDSGYVDDDGEFVSFNGNETGWQTDAYTHWMPLPAPPKEKSPRVFWSFRKAWCELTGGHDNEVLSARQLGRQLFSLKCRRCGKQTKWYELSQP